MLHRLFYKYFDNKYIIETLPSIHPSYRYSNIYLIDSQVSSNTVKCSMAVTSHANWHSKECQ